MKHIQTLSRRPVQAQDPTMGQILVTIGQIIGIIGAALAAKEAPAETTT